MNTTNHMLELRMLQGKCFTAALMAISVAVCTADSLGQCQIDRFVFDDPNFETFLGRSVAASDDLVLVGAEGYDDAAPGKGVALLFRVGDDGFELQETFREDLGGDWFARAVAMDGDRLAITSRTTYRSCFIYERIGTDWVFATELMPPGDPVNDHFGEDVVLQGDTIVVTIPHHNGVYVYEQDGWGNWEEPVLLRPADMSTVHDFGRALAISGDTLLVGAPGDQAHGLGSGSAFVFERDDLGEWKEGQKLMPDDLVALDQFGLSVAIEGDTAFVGSPGWPPDTAHVYQRGADGVWREEQRLHSDSGTDAELFSASMSVKGEMLLVGDNGYGYDWRPMAGSGHLFLRDADGTWRKIARITSPDVGAYGKIGSAVALTDFHAVMGGPREEIDGVSFAGCLQLFTLGEGGPDYNGNLMPDLCECVGDVDGDKDVDGDDLHELLQTWGQHNPWAVDLDGDNDTDQSDLGILLTYYGQICD